MLLRRSRCLLWVLPVLCALVPWAADVPSRAQPDADLQLPFDPLQGLDIANPLSRDEGPKITVSAQFTLDPSTRGPAGGDRPDGTTMAHVFGDPASGRADAHQGGAGSLGPVQVGWSIPAGHAPTGPAV